MKKSDSGYAVRWAKKIKAVRMMGGKCVDCGETSPFVLDFHHNSCIKEQNVGVALHRQRLGDALEEASKCCLLCASCHMERHSAEYLSADGRAQEAKKNAIEVLGKPACSECGHTTSTLASLEFHHVGGKGSFLLSNAFCRKHAVSAEDLLLELGKCVLLCRNCHRIKSVDSEKFQRLLPDIEKRIEGGIRVKKRINVEAILREYKDGRGVCFIARKLGYNKSTVSTILKRMGMEGRGPVVKLADTHA